MKLKKINPNLQKAISEFAPQAPHQLLFNSFGTVKSGVDIVLVEDEKSQMLFDVCVHSIQKTEKAHMQSPRVLIVVPSKEHVFTMMEEMTLLAKYTNLRLFGVHEHSDLDDDKNLISVGIDVLIGTPHRLNEMFSTAGFDVNQLKLWVFYELDVLMKNRTESILYRLNESIQRPQRLFMTLEVTEKVEMFIDNISEEAVWFFNEEEDQEEGSHLEM